MKRIFPVILSLMMMLSGTVFASAEAFTVSVTVGEHGIVNGHANTTFQETVESLALNITADEGYVIDAIAINGKVDETHTAAAKDKPTYTATIPITAETTMDVFFKSSSTGQYTIHVTSEGPGTIVAPFEGADGTYTATSTEEERTIMWVADADKGSVVKSVTINGEPDVSSVGLDMGSYICTEGNVDIHVVFEAGAGGGDGSDEDEDLDVYEVTTSAGKGGTVTKSFTYVGGEKQTVKYKADDGYVIDKVYINEELKKEDSGKESGSYSFSKGDQKIEVTFKTASGSGSNGNKAGNVKTGDRHNTIFYVVMTATAIIGAGLYVGLKKLSKIKNF